MKRADGWNGRKMSFHTGSRWSQRRLPIELMDDLGYIKICELSEPLGRRRGSALNRRATITTEGNKYAPFAFCHSDHLVLCLALRGSSTRFYKRDESL